VTISRKAAFSLLISTLLFAVFTVLAFTGLFDLVEARFYNPAAARAISREIDADTRVIEEFFEELQTRFAATLNEGAVRRSLLADLESEDIDLRASLYGELLESLGGLQSVRFIDSGGRRIHFSTWLPDILRQDRDFIAYRNYGAEENSAAYIPYGQVEATVPRLILDGPRERILFSYPFYDSFDVYRGTALFSLSVRAVMDRMVNAGRIKVGEEISVVSEPPGLVTGLPAVGRNVLLPLIARLWSENSLSLGILNSGLTGVNLALISRKTAQDLYLGRLVNGSMLSFPLAMKIILMISFLITVYLIIFLLFNLRQDDITIIQSRLKKLQVNLLEEYYEHSGNVNWNRWKRELEHRREDVRSELKRGLNAKTGAGGLVEIDHFIDRSWDDLMAIIGGHLERRAGIDEDALKTLLGRLLPETSATAAIQALDNRSETEEPVEIETLDEADIVEALEGPAERKMALEAPEPVLEELEAAEPELAELEGLEDSEPELAELEPAELEPIEPEDETPEPEPAELEAAEPDPRGPENETPDPEPSGNPGPEPAELGAVEPDLVGQENETPEPEPSGNPEPDLAEVEGLEDSEPELAELEAMELELIEPEDGRVETITSFQGVDPAEFEDFDESAIDNLARTIEFSPDPQEIAEEKEKAARSMAEHFEIQSPFVSIFSTLSELEFEPEPMEDLESLEREWLAPDNSREAEMEELRSNFAGPQLSIPFQGTNNEITLLIADRDTAPEETGELETEEEASAEDGIILERDGVSYINESALQPDKETLKGLDRNFKNLVDSILNNT
jgi:hypothetical protein